MAKQDDKVGMALIGIGGWGGIIGSTVLRSKKAKLVTCYARTPENRLAVSRKHGCDQEKSFEDVLRRDDVEGVLLFTPNAYEHATSDTRPSPRCFER